jgi:hypothetical protein
MPLTGRKKKCTSAAPDLGADGGHTLRRRVALYLTSGVSRPRALDASRTLAWSAGAGTCRYRRDPTRALPGYHGDNPRKKQDDDPPLIPYATGYQ